MCTELESKSPEAEIALKYMQIVMQYFRRGDNFPELVAKAFEKHPDDQSLGTVIILLGFSLKKTELNVSYSVLVQLAVGCLLHSKPRLGERSKGVFT